MGIVALQEGYCARHNALRPGRLPPKRRPRTFAPPRRHKETFSTATHYRLDIMESALQRRALLRGAAALPIILSSPPSRAADGEGTPFSAATVRDAARALASKPFQAPETGLP